MSSHIIRLRKLATRGRQPRPIFLQLVLLFALLGLLASPFLPAVPLPVAALSAGAAKAPVPKSETTSLTRLSESVNAASWGNPSVSLSDGYAADAGPEELWLALQNNRAEPLGLISADFDEDGVIDLIGSYEYQGRGILSVWRGNQGSMYPQIHEAQARRTNKTTESAFLSQAAVFESPIAADFIGAGDFDADGHWDIVSASRGGSVLYYWLGDGHGNFPRTQKKQLPGVVTALVCGDVNRADGLADLVVGVSTPARAQTLVYEGPNGALNAEPEAFAISTPVTALSLGQLDNDQMLDIAVGTASRLLLIHGRDRKLTLNAEQQAEASKATVEQRLLKAPLTALVAGEFTADGRTDLAWLNERGQVWISAQPDATAGRQAVILRTWPAQVVAGTNWTGVSRLSVGRLGNAPHDSLLGLDGRGQLRLLTSYTERPESFAEAGKLTGSKAQFAETTLPGVSAPAALLSLRLNGDALDDLVLLQRGTVAPIVVAGAPSAIITVNSSADTNVRDNLLTLREAILLANEDLLKTALTVAEQGQVQGTPAPGLDEVRFNIPPGSIANEEGVIEPPPEAAASFVQPEPLHTNGTPNLSFGNGPDSVQVSPTFTGQTAYSSLPATAKPHSIAAFNKAGRPGLAVTNRAAPGQPGDSVTVFYANSVGGSYNGTFAAGVTYPLNIGSQPQGVAVGNLGQLNVPSLVVAASNINQVAVLLGNGLGDDTFRAAVYYNVGVFPESLTLGNFNGDANLDIAVANYGNATISVLIGNSDGSFQSAVTAVTLEANSGPEFIVAGDFNNDGKVDLATCNSGNIPGNKVHVVMGNGNGTFQTPAGIYTTGPNPWFMTSADFNGDGKLDLATSSHHGAVSVLLNSGTGTFPTKTDYAAGLDPNSISTADVNLDGFPELIVASGGGNRACILVNNTNGTFQQPVFDTTAVSGTAPNAVAGGDFNVDGKPDIAIANTGNNTIGVLLNTTVDTCGFALNPTMQNFPSVGGNGNINVTAASGCTWAATSNDSWLTSTSSGNGNGIASYTVAANSNPARTSTLAIGGHLFTVTQDSGCTYSINPTVQNVVAAGGNGFVSITAGAGCPWTAVSNAPWISIVGSPSGTGNGTANYNVQANTGIARTGTMTIAGQVFTVLQNAGGSCSYTIAPQSQSFGPASGTGTVSVTAPVGCNWTAVSNNPSFITITGGASGSGNGTVSYSVSANGTGSPRSGTVTITGGNTFTVIQATANSNLRSITLTSPLPQITDPITIDGWTQGGGGYTGPPLIEINGQNLAAQSGLLSRDGLRITAGSSTIRGLALNRFTSATRDAAIRLTTNGNNVIEGCYLGSDANGTNAFAPANTNGLASGITIQSSSDNQIGGSTAAKRNLISGIDGAGITIGNGSTRNLVQGNYLGTDVTGSIRLTDISGNGYQRIGIYIQNASGNTVGGTTAGAGNLISGNLDYGVFEQDESANNLVQGNIIGANAAGAAPVPNGNAGVFLYRPSGTAATIDNTVGGTSPSARNLISGNEPYGVVVGVGASGTLVQGNYIGTNAGGTAALGNTYGITVTQATGSTVGGDPITAPGARNVISGNRLTGVYVGFLNNGQAGGTGVTVQGNYVGTDASGDNALGNSRDGIFVEVQSASDTIQANRIAYNGNSGIRIPNVSDVPGTPGVRIQLPDNSIYANTALGIDLGDAGVTQNDSLDADVGANLQQNFPVLTSISPSAAAGLNREKGTKPQQTNSQTVSGTLNSTPNSTFTVHWYFADVASCISNQANNRPLALGRVPNVATNSQGNAQFSFPFDFPVGTNSGIINTTATDSNGNTSEFSACFSVTAPLPTNLQFNATGYGVNEAGVSSTITVTRTGNTASTSTVDFRASDGSATQNQDYVVTSGTLNFAAGQSSKTFDVLIVNDAFIEGAEAINLTLSNPTGGSLGTQSTATVTIIDNDTAGATSPAAKRFAAMLDGAQETPANNSTAKGTGYVLLNPSETGASLSLQFQNLGSAQLSAHIHGPGAAGVMAPILFTLPTTNPANAQISPTAQQVADLKAGLHYFNVHSNNFPNGEIRGQLRWNPTLDENFFVRQQYLDFLSRDGDPGGFGFWVNQVGFCGADAQCLHDRTITTSNAFFFEPEFQQTAGYVFRAYRAAFGNNQPFPNPDSSNATEANKLIDYGAFVADRARVVGGADLALAQQAFATQFVLRAAFTTKYAAATTGAQFVDAILANIQSANGANLTGQRQALIDQFNNAGGGNAGRARVLYRLADDNAQNPINNQAFINAEYNRQFALTLFFGYLRRNPDIGGFLFWQGQINLAPVRDVPKQNALVCSFLTAAEYQLRFGPNAPRSNAECPQ